jgi:hypothetical protein
VLVRESNEALEVALPEPLGRDRIAGFKLVDAISNGT